MDSQMKRLLECPVTLEPYTSSGPNRPYVLPCGHTLSRAALKEVLAGTRLCPIDRVTITARTIKDCSPNYKLMDLMNEMEVSPTDDFRLDPKQLRCIQTPDTLLGVGGSARVYRGVLIRGGEEEDVAVKVFPLQGADRQLLEWVYRELTTLCIVTRKVAAGALEFKGFVERPGQELLMVMELAECSLVQAMAQHEGSRLPPGTWIAVALQLVAALRRLHDLNIIHRDVSTSNVMRSQEGVYKLADFGISHVCTHTAHVTNHNAPGNPAYMAPEQSNRRARISSPADVWCFASTMLHAWTGQAPYPGYSQAEIIGAQVREQLAPDVAATDLPQEVKQMFQLCFDFDPTRRPSMGVVQARLRRLKASLPIFGGSSLVCDLDQGASLEYEGLGSMNVQESVEPERPRNIRRNTEQIKDSGDAGTSGTEESAENSVEMLGEQAEVNAGGMNSWSWVPETDLQSLCADLHAGRGSTPDGTFWQSSTLDLEGHKVRSSTTLAPERPCLALVDTSGSRAGAADGRACFEWQNSNAGAVRIRMTAGGMALRRGELWVPDHAQLILEGDSNRILRLEEITIRGGGSTIVVCTGSVHLSHVTLTGCSLVCHNSSIVEMEGCSIARSHIALLATGPETSVVVKSCKVVECEHGVIVEKHASVRLTHCRVRSTRGAAAEARGRGTRLDVHKGSLRTSASVPTTIRPQAPDEAPDSAYAVAAVTQAFAGSTVALLGVRITEGIDGVSAVGSRARFVVDDCCFKGLTGTGICVRAGAAGRISKCILEGCKWGMRADGARTHVQVTACELKGNDAGALLVRDSASAIVQDSSALGSSRGFGVHVWGEQASAELKGCILSENKQGGLLVARGGRVVLTKCTLNGSGGGSGVLVQNASSKLEAAGCTMVGNSGNGVLVVDQADVKMRECKLSCNRVCGVSVLGASLTAFQCQSTGNGKGGYESKKAEEMKLMGCSSTGETAYVRELAMLGWSSMTRMACTPA